MKKTLLPLLLALLLLLPGQTPARAEAGEAVLPETLADNAWRLTDGDENSRLRIPAGETFALHPGETDAALLLLFHTPASGAVLTQHGTDEEPLQVDALDGRYEALLPLHEDAAELRLALTEETGEIVLSEYRFLDAEEAAAYSTLATEGQVDLMLVAAHAGDEVTVFSGLLPQLAERRLSSITVFFSHENRMAQQEAIESAHLFQQGRYPIFFSQQHLRLIEAYENKARKIWPEKESLESLVTAIRQYRPTVIVTHGGNGEDGDMLHGYTAELVQTAVEWAADARKHRKSAERYGTHEVQKLYLHDVPEPEPSPTPEPRRKRTPTPTPEPPIPVALDYTLPLNAYAGRSAAQIAVEALAGYETLAIYRRTVQDADSFVLAMTRVGADTGKNDLFENIAPETLTNLGLALPTPSPTPAPTPSPTPLPTAAPTEAPEAAAAETAAEATDGKGGRGALSIAVLLSGVAASTLLFVLVYAKLAKRCGKLPAIVLCWLPLVAAVLFVHFVPMPEKTATQQMQTAERLAPATATPEDMPEPAETPVPTPTPTPDPWAAYFRQAGEPEENILADEAAGHWEYRSDTLSVLIDKHEDASVPLVWYIAHIRMREDAFRPGFGSFSENGSSRLEPWKLVRRARAVLAITGDNLINGEVNSKGRLIRNGLLYGEGDGQPTLALCPDMTLRIYERGTPAETILDDGVQNSFGFGPVLVRDGKVSEEECRLHRVKNKNPRAGIGMVEPGHYVAIVVDGRQAGYSIGIPLVDYAAMFVGEGCTIAYNMDGGISAGMLFMGESLHQHRSSNSKRSSGQRPWSDALLFGYSTLVPTEDDPIYNTGNLNERLPRESAAPAG